MGAYSRLGAYSDKYGMWKALNNILCLNLTTFFIGRVIILKSPICEVHSTLRIIRKY